MSCTLSDFYVSHWSEVDGHIFYLAIWKENWFEFVFFDDRCDLLDVFFTWLFNYSSNLIDYFVCRIIDLRYDRLLDFFNGRIKRLVVMSKLYAILGRQILFSRVALEFGTNIGTLSYTFGLVFIKTSIASFIEGQSTKTFMSIRQS